MKHQRGPVRCIETGQVYESASAAARSYKATRCAMANHLAGRIGTLCGMRFERVSAVRLDDKGQI